jgi:hypothetical protein
MINKKDIAEINIVGVLNGENVTRIRTKGGYNIFIGKTKKGAADSVLTGSSHIAIGLHNLEQQFSNFQPTLAKSESEPLEQVTDVSDKLSDIAKNIGYKCHLLKNGNCVKISLSKDNFEAGVINLTKSEDSLTINHYSLKVKENNPRLKEELSKNLAKIIEDMSEGK